MGDGNGRLELPRGVVAGRDVAGFKHQEGPAEVAIRRARDVDGQFVGEGDVFLAGDGLQDRADLEKRSMGEICARWVSSLR